MELLPNSREVLDEEGSHTDCVIRWLRLLIYQLGLGAPTKIEILIKLLRTGGLRFSLFYRVARGSTFLGYRCQSLPFVSPLWKRFARLTYRDNFLHIKR